MNERNAQAYLFVEPLAVIVLFGLSLTAKFTGIPALALATTLFGVALTVSIIRYHDRAMHTLR